MEEDEERFLLTESTSESECSRDSNGGPRDIGELLLTPPSQRREAAGEGEGEATDHTASPRYRLYRWRWLMLASLCLLNVSNGMVRRRRRERGREGGSGSMRAHACAECSHRTPGT